MDESQGAAQAIIALLGSGELTYEEATRRLAAAIEQELRKPPAEIRESFIKACEELAFILNTDKEIESEIEEGREKLRKLMEKLR